MYTRPTEPRSIGGVLDDGLRLWRDSLAKAWPLSLIAQLVVAVPFLVLGYKLKGFMPTAPGAPHPISMTDAEAMMALMKSPVTWLTYLGMVVLSAWIYTALVLRIAAIADGADSSLGAVLSKGLRLLPRLLVQFLFLILIGVAIGVAAAVLGVVANKGIAAIVFFILFFVIFFIFGRVFFASMVLVLDDAGPVESIAISWRLTRGYWWRCAGILLVLFIIGLVFSLVVGFVAAAFGGGVRATSLFAIGSTQVLSLVVNTVLGSLYPSVLIAILYDLKLRKQGGDLLGRVDALARQ